MQRVLDLDQWAHADAYGNTKTAIQVPTPGDLGSPGVAMALAQQFSNRTRYLANRLGTRIVSATIAEVAGSEPVTGNFADVNGAIVESITGVGIGDWIVVRGYVGVVAAKTGGGAAPPVWVRTRITDATPTNHYSQARLFVANNSLATMNYSCSFEWLFVAVAAGTHVVAPQFDSGGLSGGNSIALDSGAPCFLEANLWRVPPTLP